MLTDTTSVSDLIAQFSHLIQAHQIDSPQPAELSEMLAALSDIPQSQLGPDPEAAEKKRAELAKPAAESQIKRRIAQVFPLLDERLLQLQRWLIVEWQSASFDALPVILSESRSCPEGVPTVLNGRSRQPWQQAIQIPLVLQRSRRLEYVPPVVHPKANRRWDGQYRLKCSFPGDLLPQLVQQANEARAVFFEVLAELYRTPWARIGEQIRMVPPSVDALWIPRLEDIGFESVPPQTRDPALVICYNKQMFVVGTWTVEQEQSLEYLLSEFSWV